MESKSSGIIIIGKYSLIREGISRILQARNFRILASASCANQLSVRVRTQKLLFLIVHTNDDFDHALAEIELVKDTHPDACVAIVADHYRPSEPALAFKAGAIGYLVNTVSCDAFVKSVELVMLGEAVFPPIFPSMAMPAAPKHLGSMVALVSGGDEEAPAYIPPGIATASLLSPREIAILRCLIEGDANKSIARKIGIAEATVKAHVKAILRKTRVQNRTQAAIWGMNNALLVQPANNNSLPLVAAGNKMLPESALSVYQV